jgi:hypothetical protein
MPRHPLFSLFERSSLLRPPEEESELSVAFLTELSMRTNKHTAIDGEACAEWRHRKVKSHPLDLVEKVLLGVPDPRQPSDSRDSWRPLVGSPAGRTGQLGWSSNRARGLTGFRGCGSRR